jgi:CheY-like chemotaxis protein
LVNVRQLIRETERMLRPMIPRTIAVSTLVPGDIWPVRGNSTRLYQVLVNLCLNARDAMPTGGTLTLAVDNVEMDAEEAAAIRGASVGSYVAFTVADTGIGIAPENLEKVFEPFFTTKAADKGTGLGLTTVSHIVRAASGFIHVESELGVGTTFQVFLPKADTSNQTEMMRAIGDPRPCVVVVDDEHALHSLYSTTLEAHGFRTVVVPDMLEALEQIRRIGPARLVAVIIDGELPGTDSQQLLQAIRGQNASVRIVWVRGPSAASPEADSVVVLQRPVLAEALVAAVVSKT